MQDSPATREDLLVRDSARMTLYRFFALALTDPAARRRADLVDHEFLSEVVLGARFLSSSPETRPAQLAAGERSPEELALDGCVKLLQECPRAVENGYRQIFGLLMAQDCPPYETEYCPQTFSVYRSHQIADVAGFYRAFGLQTALDCPERTDHVALELDFMSWLIAKGAHARQVPELHHGDDVCRDAERRFFEAHLAWWIPAFARALEMKVQSWDPADRASRFHVELVRNLAAFVAAERAILAVDPPSRLAAPAPDDEASEPCRSCESGSTG